MEYGRSMTKENLPWLTEAGLATLSKGYLLEGEEPIDLFQRVARSASYRLNRPALYPFFLEAMTKNWLCLATPVASNMGTTRGLPISCYGINVGDSVYNIFDAATEMAMLTQRGGGVGIGINAVRPRGTPISGGGVSEGIVPWAKIYDTGIVSVSQQSVRRGAASINLDVEHGDFSEFIRIRRPTGDHNRQCLNLNQAVLCSDEFMESLEAGHTGNRAKWETILSSRLETGEPYIMFSSTVNRSEPSNRPVTMTNICSEITLFSDPEHTFVCCLSSLNLAKWDEWKDYKFGNGMTLPELAIWFLDGVMEEFIQHAQGKPGFEKAVRFATKSRALGLGVLGWHTYLQEHELPFAASVEVMGLTYRIFKFMKEEADKATSILAQQYGSPDWADGTRNTHLIALAPTVSNATISGGVSPSIEPLAANAFAQKTAKGVFMFRNPTLAKTLIRYDRDNSDVWASIVANEGSVQHLDFLSEGEKELYLTAREINQLHTIKLAAQRAPFIDQSQSINLFFPVNVDPDWFNMVHMEAWKSGIKTLYYVRSGSILKGDVASRAFDEECAACEG